MGKIFVQLHPEEKFFRMTVKCNPDQAYFYRSIYPDVVVRGYHCPPVQQPYWNTIDLDTFEDSEVLFQMIDEAYEAIVKKLKKKEQLQLLQLTKLEYRYTDGEDADFTLLCEKLEDDLDELVSTDIQRNQYDQYNKRDSIHDVIVVYEDNEPVACGAFMFYDEERAELKRMYVTPALRGNGIGAEIIRRLEAKAKMKGFKRCILETGAPLEASCNLYKRMRYKIIPNYGQYAEMEEPICMERKI